MTSKTLADRTLAVRLANARRKLVSIWQSKVRASIVVCVAFFMHSLRQHTCTAGQGHVCRGDAWPHVALIMVQVGPSAQEGCQLAQQPRQLWQQVPPQHIQLEILQPPWRLSAFSPEVNRVELFMLFPIRLTLGGPPILPCIANFSKVIGR